MFCLCRLRIWSSNGRNSSNITLQPPPLSLRLLIFQFYFQLCFTTIPKQFLHLCCISRCCQWRINWICSKSNIGKLKSVEGEDSSHSSKKHIIIGMGSNDIATYFLTPFHREYNIEEYTSMLVNISSNFLQVCFWCEQYLNSR